MTSYLKLKKRKSELKRQMDQIDEQMKLCLLYTSGIDSNNTSQLENVSTQIGMLLHNGEMPQEVSDAIKTAYAGLGNIAAVSYTHLRMSHSVGEIFWAH